MVERTGSIISGLSINFEPSSITLPNACIVKEGWLNKRAEYLKNWRQRYFFLLENGMLLGFRTKPEIDLSDPLNNFHVKGCRVLETEKPKPNTFILRGLHWTTVIERKFYANSPEEREDWISEIMTIKERLAEASSGTDIENDDSLFYSDAGIASAQRRITMDDFEFLKVLGKGSFGKVILCREKSSQKLYAVKCLRKDVIKETEELAHVLTENRVLQTIDHPFLIHLKYSFTNEDRLFFALEYVIGGELFYHLSKDRKFNEERAQFYGAEICLALGYLHQRDIIYRDLKLENLLLDCDGHIKVADFGLCKEAISHGSTTKTLCGTPANIAPEVLLDAEYGRSVDWWAYGVCLYEMMVGKLPFSHKIRKKLFDKIVNEDVEIPRTLTNEAGSFLSSLLIKDPKNRLGGGQGDYNEVMAHSFFHNIDWELMFDKKVEPPFKPVIDNETDTKYFDPEFTKEAVQLTPPENKLKVIVEDFEGFSYQAKSASTVSSNSLAFSFTSFNTCSS